MTKKLDVAVIGLGSMGYGIARSSLRGGHRTWGVDVNPDQTARFAAEGGASGDLRDVAAGLDAVAVVVLNAAQTEAVLFGDAGVVPLLKRGSVVLACATVPPASRCCRATTRSPSRSWRWGGRASSPSSPTRSRT